VLATSYKRRLSFATQAVIFPSAMANVMEETQLRKARMLGGKLGKKVLSLLPENETTMGSIARLMPLDQLVKAIGVESGRWVFDACRGIDYEEVKATLKVLPKSITVSLVWNLERRESNLN
jgi:DNA polymerase eta